MHSVFKKALAASLVALTLAAGLAASATPAAADGWRDGGHGGWGHGGGWRRDGGHGDWGRGGGWRRDGWAPGLGLGLAGGLAAGAIIASQAQPYYGYGGCWQVRPTYDSWGNYLGDQQVNVCQ